MSKIIRSSNLLCRERSHVLVVDVQEKLIPVIDGQEPIVGEIGLLLDAAEILNVPVTLSEQYPDGLGPTIPAIREHASIQNRFDKLRFSAASGFCRTVSQSETIVHDRQQQVVLVGIETHICILQTALDLQRSGWDVCVVANAVGSRRMIDHEVGLARLSAAGVAIVTTESVLFEWCEVAGTDEFRQISRLVRNHQPGE